MSDYSNSDEELPENWGTAKDENGQKYYYNTITGIPQWDKPMVDRNSQPKLTKQESERDVACSSKTTDLSSPVEFKERIAELEACLYRTHREKQNEIELRKEAEKKRQEAEDSVVDLSRKLEDLQPLIWRKKAVFPDQKRIEKSSKEYAKRAQRTVPI